MTFDNTLGIYFLLYLKKNFFFIFDVIRFDVSRLPGPHNVKRFFFRTCVLFLLVVVAEKSEISVGRQFRGRPEKRDERGTTPVQTFGRPILGQQKPEQRGNRVSAKNGLYANHLNTSHNFLLIRVQKSIRKYVRLSVSITLIFDTDLFLQIGQHSKMCVSCVS